MVECIKLIKRAVMGEKNDWFHEGSCWSISSFSFCAPWYMKTPSFKVLLFFSSFGGNTSYLFILEIIKWNLWELLLWVGLINRSLLQLVEWASSILIRRLCHLNLGIFAPWLCPKRVIRRTRQKVTNACTSKCWFYFSKYCSQKHSSMAVCRNKWKIVHKF